MDVQPNLTTIACHMVNGVAVPISETSPIPTTNYLLEVAKGNIPGTSSLVLRGHNPDIDTTTEDITEFGDFTYLTSAETLNITSTDNADKSDGTGLRTLLIQGVDDTYAAIQEVVTLDGTANATTTLSYLRVNTMVGLTCGSDNTNVGNITAKPTVTTAATQDEMDAGEGVSQSALYTVPLGKKAIVNRFELNTSKASGQAPLVTFRAFGRNAVGAPFIQLFDKRIDTSNEDSLEVNLGVPFAGEAGTDLRMNATSDKPNTDCRVRVYFLIVDA